MDSDFIPADVEQFIRKRIDSVAQLEALLLLRSNDQVDWSVDAKHDGCMFGGKWPGKY